MEITSIKNNFNAEIALLVLCCRCYLQTADESSLHLFLKENKIDWDHFYKLSATHRVRPIMYKVLSPYKETIIPFNLTKLKDYCTYFNAFALNNKRELDRILHVLSQNNIPAKPFKGLDFAQHIYEDTCIREFSDNDIIIKEADLEQLIGIMINEGYHSKDIEFYKRFPRQYIRDYKDLLFEKANGSKREFAFEFHFKPARYFQGYPLTFEQVLGKNYLSAPKQFNETNYLKLITISNGLMDVYPNIRSVLDLAVLLKRKGEIAQPEYNNLLKEYIKYGILLSFRLFNFPAFVTPDKKVIKLGNKLFEKILRLQNGYRIPILQYLLLNIKISSIEDKIKLLKAYYFLMIRPSLQDVSSIKLKRYSVYYFIKPFRVLNKFFRGINILKIL